jgi:hypothetical protein
VGERGDVEQKGSGVKEETFGDDLAKDGLSSNVVDAVYKASTTIPLFE